MKTQINDDLKHKKAFTLVELIIVITILVILATIAFVSFQNYTKDSRDANRLTTINNISKGLDVFQIKTGFYPEPESKISFTGAGDKKLHQGIISDNITNTINLSEIPLDPKEKTNYIYSTYGDGKYYQIASEAENITSFLYNTTYAENKSSIVRGNYKFDPSLPSLIVIPNSLTGSSIFNPKVCFVTNGGLNSISSNSGTCLKKEEMSLNTIDNSLVGYWDMETIFNSGGTDYLKDLSGNNNHGVFSGGMIYNNSLTGGMVGKGLNFNDLNKNFIEIPTSKSLEISNGELTITTTIKAYKNELKGILTKQSTGRGADLSSGCSVYNNYCGYHLRTGIGKLTGRVYDKIYNGYTTHDRTRTADYNYTGSFIILTYSIKNGSFGNVYVNGVLLKTNDIVRKTSEISVSKNPLKIGRYWNDYDGGVYEFFDGIIDEVKIYNRALTDQEIAQQARIAGF